MTTKAMASVSPMPAVKNTRWRRYVNHLLGVEVSALTRFADEVLLWRPLEPANDRILDTVVCTKKKIVTDEVGIGDFSSRPGYRAVILVNGTFNHHYDIEGALRAIKPKLSRSSRIQVITYNPYLSWLFRLANWLGVRKGEIPTTFITRTDYENIATLAGFKVVRHRPVAYFPWKLLGLGSLINKFAPIVPLVRWTSLASVLTLRPMIAETKTKPSLSVVIPARNERGNIENALKRMPDLGAQLEVIFVEGHSSDGTWEEIQRVMSQYNGPIKLQAFQQTGKGKNDAVRLGFKHARNDLLTILDADLTMPPELLGRFYDAYCNGLADFVNGTRLAYPMEGEAMRFLNHLGNVFFAKALSYVLDTRLGDSLCGTKLVRREDYQRIVQWRDYFGDFDPFGDFELLFPAAVLGLGVVDIPIRYRARTYGSTNISRFRHGWMLLKMTTIGFFRLKIGKTS